MLLEVELERLASRTCRTPGHPDACFTVRAGEVVGIAGLMGSGRTELAMSIFGRSYGRNITGEVRLRGKPVDVSTVDRAIDAGLSYVTEDRKSLGLVLDETIRFNTTLANLPAVSSGGILNATRKRASPKNTAMRWRSARRPFSRRWSTCRAATSRRSCSPNG
jgi:putative multiple sugar transport system ATP-binding protein